MTDKNRLALILVGDELLSGRRADKHLSQMTQVCEARGLEIVQVWMVGDDEAILTQVISDALRPIGGARVPVISFGGIGGTPDDRTREAVAAAAGVELELHADALSILESRYGKAELHDHRLNMIRFPSGAKLIPNPVNQVPGFYLDRLYCVPGFPEMAWPMAEWVLDKEFATRFEAPVTCLLRAGGTARESDYVFAMHQTRADFPTVKVSSLPHMGQPSGDDAHIEFGFRGPSADAQAARARFQSLAQDAGLSAEVV